MNKVKSIIAGILPIAVFFMAVQVGVALEGAFVEPANANIIPAKQTGIKTFSPVNGKNKTVLTTSATRVFESTFMLNEDADSPLNPENYTLAPNGSSCNTGEEICSIIAPIANPTDPQSEWEPDISGQVATDLANILATAPHLRTPTDLVKLKD